MTPKEAEEIIINYSKVIKKKLRPHAIVQPLSDLPCSPGKIMFAHFLYGEYLVKENLLTKELGDSLISSYASIRTIFVEESETINIRFRKYLKDLDKGIVPKDFDPGEYTIVPEYVIEFNNFLADCQGRYKNSNI